MANANVLGRGAPGGGLRLRSLTTGSIRTLLPWLSANNLSGGAMSVSTLPVASLGTPRIGPRRELKVALESYWSGKVDEYSLLETAAALRAANWARQRSRGVTVIPSNDFSLYDHVLDTSVMVGAIPEIYGWTEGPVSLKTYLAMARGSRVSVADSGNGAHREGVPAQEMTKWFDTNYHYIVPEFQRGQRFQLGSLKPVDEYLEARSLGFQTRPVLLGPVTYLTLGKSKDADFDPISLLTDLLPVYTDVLQRLHEAGADWVQLDEPCLALDIDGATRDALRDAYERFAEEVPGLKVMLTAYFGALGNNLDAAVSLPVAGLHVDLVRAPEQLVPVAAAAPSNMVLSLGVIDGRNVWRAELSRILDVLEPVVAARGREFMQVAPSCSMLHVPLDLELETDLDGDLRSWLSFSIQKMDELSTIGRALDGGRGAVGAALTESAAAAASRRASPKVHDSAVADRVASIEPRMARRDGDFAARAGVQRSRLNLPLFPTTTIGSFPQTSRVRRARAEHARGSLSDAEYQSFLEDQTAQVIAWQESIGLDVLVHGEFERNDMVQYFGERLSGFAFTRNGWVQSYGSRCVRPPILFGDVSRPVTMTVRWWRYAQSLTSRPVKGMLTGPVTILNWSFVRDDIPREATCRQIALAIRDEVLDLEAAGARVIQVDEAALREGLPLRREDWDEYLRWAVECFRLCSSGVRDETQIHTHMCYSEFNDIIAAIASMDADAMSIETSRSKMELLDVFESYRYPNGIGPGVYDIHSPRVPAVDEITALLRLARERLADSQLWVNPDCGLKTRKWEEVRPALVNMVAAAKELRRA